MKRGLLNSEQDNSHIKTNQKKTRKVPTTDRKIPGHTHIHTSLKLTHTRPHAHTHTHTHTYKHSTDRYTRKKEEMIHTDIQQRANWMVLKENGTHREILCGFSRYIRCLFLWHISHCCTSGFYHTKLLIFYA